LMNAPQSGDKLTPACGILQSCYVTQLLLSHISDTSCGICRRLPTKLRDTYLYILM